MATAPREVSLLALSMGLYPGAILWGLQLWLSYGLVNVACGHGFDPMFHLVSLVFAGLTGLTVLLSFRLWRSLHSGSALADGAHRRAEFMALSGVASNSLFLLFIIVGGIPSFVFDPCLG